MEQYKNLNGDSGISHYEIGEDYIIVKFFTTPKPYKYSYNSAGMAHIEYMKVLAINGTGLNSYIKRNVNSLYER